VVRSPLLVLGQGISHAHQQQPIATIQGAEIVP
jgi:hypothetical protein